MIKNFDFISPGICQRDPYSTLIFHSNVKFKVSRIGKEKFSESPS